MYQKIGRITPAGTITYYPAPNLNNSDGGITVGPDGAIWFAQFPPYDTPVVTYPSLARMTTDGKLTEFTPSSSEYFLLGQLVVGPDKALYSSSVKTDDVNHVESYLIQRITINGSNIGWYEYITPAVPASGGGGGGVASGPDGGDLVYRTQRDRTADALAPRCKQHRASRGYRRDGVFRDVECDLDFRCGNLEFR
jgi:hypothetical protein